MASAAISSDWATCLARPRIVLACTAMTARSDYGEQDDSQRDGARNLSCSARPLLFGLGLPFGCFLLTLEASRLAAPAPVQDRGGEQVVRDLESRSVRPAGGGGTGRRMRSSLPASR